MLAWCIIATFLLGFLLGIVAVFSPFAYSIYKELVPYKQPKPKKSDVVRVGPNPFTQDILND